VSPSPTMSTGPGEATAPEYVWHQLDLDVLGPVRVMVARGGDEDHDLACIVHGEVGQSPLVRVHSRCLYGEVFGSKDCDCRAQLLAALHLIAEAGSGIVVYLDQEGRGAGLFRKAQGYELSQRLGVDSFSAYEALSLECDTRRYADAARLLRTLGVMSIRLITNNPEKVAGMRTAGVEVERVPLDPDALGFPVPAEAEAYVRAKQARGHLLPD
jgi:GTP cyclohydrolase II